MSMQPRKVFNHGCTRMHTDERHEFHEFSRIQHLPFVPIGEIRVSLLSGSIRVHPWLIILAFVFWSLVGGASTPETTTNIFECSAAPTPESQVDKLVFAELARLKIEPVLCSDAVFVRRVYLDVIGRLPGAKEARQFIEDPDTKNKRSLLIDRLLERDEFADYWARD